MIKGGHQFDLLGQQHAIAKHVARHVADTDDGERLGLGVVAHLPEVALNGFPAAPGGDAHLLMVVPNRATRGKGVAQPMAVIGTNAIGDVREGRSALVGGDHQIGIILIPTDDMARRHNPAIAGNVVGQVQQTTQESPIGFNGDGLDFVAVASRWQGFREESTF